YFERMNLENCIFSEVPIQYTIDPNKHVASFRNSDFECAKFFNCNFKNVTMCESYARGSTFINCDFSNARLSSSNFFGAYIINCDFKDAEMKNMRLSAINQSNLCGANLLSTKCSLLNDVTINHKTILPDGTKIHP